MTVRHIVLFRWKSSTSQEEKDALSRDLPGLAASIPSVMSYDFGPDVVGQEGNFDFAIIAGFDDVDGYHAYADDAGHQSFIRDRIRPLISERAALQVGF